MVRLPITLVGDNTTLLRFLEFLAFFQYNGGHSGLFAMPFDGDGADRLGVENAEVWIPRSHVRGAQRIAGVGGGVEVANGNGVYTTQKIEHSHRWVYRNGVLYRPDGTPAKIYED